MVRLAFLCSFLLVGCDGNTPAPLPVGTVPSSPASQPQEDDRLTEARTKLARLEERRAEILRLMDRASNERDRLVTHLHELGVKSSADLKGNPQAASYAQRLQRTALEIQSLQRDAAHFDTAIHQAKELIRRLERSSALEDFDDELATVAEQVMELDETLGDGTPLDPIQQAAMLDQQLQRLPADDSAPAPTATAPDWLVGKWQVPGNRLGAVEFTSGGTALLSWDSLGPRQATLKFSVSRNVLRLQEPGEYGQTCDVQIEIVSDDELIFINQKNSMSFDWLDGRVNRVE